MQARAYLALDTGGGTRLAILMWTYLEDYVADQGPEPLTGTFERFIGWTRPRLGSRTADGRRKPT